jgi:hypothetical protein
VEFWLKILMYIGFICLSIDNYMRKQDLKKANAEIAKLKRLMLLALEQIDQEEMKTADLQAKIAKSETRRDVALGMRSKSRA